MKQKKPISLRRRILILITICWIVPVILIFLYITISYRNSIIEKTEMLMEEWAKNFTSLHAQKIDEAITISKKPSYELVIEKAWKKYRDGTISHTEFYREVIGNLISKFYNDNRFVISVFYLCDSPERLYYTSRQPADYIKTYHEIIESEANKITAMDTSDAHVRIINNKLYIIRNLYTTTNYTKFGTLVLELNQDRLFGGISKDKDYEMGFLINSNESMIYCDQSLSDDSKADILQKLKSKYSTAENRTMIKENSGVYTGLLYQQKFDDYHFATVLIANKDIIYSELNEVRDRIILILTIIIPVFIYMLYFITRHISIPIGRMIEALKELEKGNIGMQIEGDPMPNAEFTFLLNSFNRMSSELKYIIDYAYNEELAKKEAKIIALQSQINPHFLNNTLEMMNWQARMAGDVEVSKMIEALSTLLDYSMDRSNKKMIHLSEELRCADAYLYIASMRFGQRLHIEKEIDETLLDTLVPQLILQPIIENAVVHGVEVVNSGMIKLKVFKESDNVILQVINTGKNMTEEDVERIQNILNSKTHTNTSLGIRNVNERVKLLYGEEYGLTILPIGEGEISSTITIPSKPITSPRKGKVHNLFMEKADGIDKIPEFLPQNESNMARINK